MTKRKRHPSIFGDVKYVTPEEGFFIWQSSLSFKEVCAKFGMTDKPTLVYKAALRMRKEGYILQKFSCVPMPVSDHALREAIERGNRHGRKVGQADKTTENWERKKRWSVLNEIFADTIGLRIRPADDGSYGTLSLENAELLAKNLNSNKGGGKRTAEEV